MSVSNQGFRLSAQQEHLWRLQQAAPGERFDAVARISIVGDLDPGVLRRALDKLVERHEILRTAFQSVPGVTIPLQVIADAAELAVEERSEPGRHRLTLVLPALCADEATLALLPAEIGRCYAACLGGGEPEPVAMQYADFAEWQAEILESEDTAAGREHWAKLDLAVSPTELAEPGIVPVPLDPEIASRLDAPFLLAAWQALLQRLSGEAGVTVAVASDGRKFDELREAFGLYASYLPVVETVDEGTPFSERVRRLQAAVDEARDWQECFSWRQRTAAGEPEPFLPFAFSYREESAPFSAAGLTFSLDESAARIDRFQAELHVLSRNGGIALELRHDLPPAEAERLAGRFLELLRGLAEEPEAAPAEIEVLSGPERRLLDELNATADPFPRDLCFHAWFERQAARVPERLAVVHAAGSLSYRELNERANQLARHLRRLGVGPEVRVGLCLERSPEMVVGILGIQKAGGAYAPIDPAYPAERRSLIVRELDGPVLLTLERHREALAGEGLPLLCLDSDWEMVAREGEENLGDTAAPENLAYVIYTSGSTGRPKGVLVAHRNLVSSTHARVLCYGEVESFLLLSSFAFDSSVAGIFGTLASGGTLVLPDEEAPRDVPRIAALLAEHRVSHLLCLPSLHAALLDLAGPASPAWNALRVVIVAGEASPASLLVRHRERLPGAELFNEYGPTEGTVWSTVQRLVPGPEDVLIGRPIANVRVHLLSPRLRRVPMGVPGELCIAGEGVARGYHDRPDLTAERFLPNPFDGEPGARMYRTGDLARHREDGTIDFLGRVDNQVKIRGYRIELEEVEAALARHPGLREVVVIAREDEPGDRRLVAYYLADAAPPNVTELRAWLRERLPEPMVPAVFVPMAELPRTPNGKVDRRALPAPGAEQDALRGAHVPPANVIEEVIADVWSGVLGHNRVGVTESFFDLGGHSLLATQMVSRLREAFQVDFTLAWLFESPTVRGLAAKVAARTGAGFVPPPIERADRNGPLPLSFAQQRLWFLQQMDPESTVYNVPGFYLLTGDLDVEALEAAISGIVRRHEVLRTTFPSVDNQPVQRIHPAGPVRIERIDLTHLAPEERRPEAERLALGEIRTPFDLAAGPVLRLKLMRLGEREHALCFNLHHIVSDGWSFDVLVRELTTLYTSGTDAELPELPIQYADFAAWQRGWLQGERLEAELSFWREQLAGAPPVLDLATDRPRPAVQSFRGAELPFRLEKDLSQDLLALGRGEAVTPFILLLAAFQALLSRYTRQRDLCVGTPIAGRNRVEIEPLIGFFVNTLVLRADLSGDPGFRQILAQARERTLLAHAHQDLPFEKLVEELSPERSLAHTPLFQAVLAWQHPAPAGLELPGLRMTPVELAGGTVKFDLMLSVRETPSGLEGAVSYVSDLFDEATIRRMLGHLRSLLESVRANPEARLSELDLLGAGERDQLIREGRAQTVLPVERCLHEGFEVQARNRPEAVALEIEGDRITYGDLDRNANRLAHHLRRLGVGPEVRVALCLERSPLMIAAILGVLKAGGAYVPLDPESPPDRLSFLLADAGAPVLLTESGLLDRLPETGSHVVCLDRIAEALAGESPERPERPEMGATPENLAYVIYTSGSTGRPKGSLITHANVVRLFDATEPWFGFGPDDVWTLFHSYAFDFSVWEIWGALLYGGRLVLVPYWVSRSPESFRELLARSGVTVLSQTPSAFRQLIQADSRDLPPLVLRRVVFGGEALDVAGLEPWFARHGDRTELVNMYGITETTVHVTWRPVRRADLERPWSSAIGQPIPDLGIHLLDESLQPSPLGVPGEIHVSGAGLGRGYLGRPGLTAERFVPDPFATTPGERLYRSGDLARYRPDGPDGELEYLGRIDHQIKIRGFRIELGEIEAALEAHPVVDKAAVLAQETGGDRRLVAYLVAASGEEPRTGELRGFLRQRLPDYMVPADFVRLDHLPLTRNGKLDRKALATMERAGTADADWVAPRTPMEETVAGIWAEVLGHGRVGAHDDFFDLGGHSLLATQVIGRLRSALGREVSLRLLFEARTVEQLAGRLEETADGAVSGPEAIEPDQAPDLDDLLLELERSV